jgi:hypothetical protein
MSRLYSIEWYDVWLMMTGEGLGRKLSLNPGTVLEFVGGSEENREISQDIRCFGRDMNRASPRY